MFMLEIILKNAKEAVSVIQYTSQGAHSDILILP